MKNYLVIITTSLLLILTSCNQQQPRYVIGVSQCSADIWREKQNAELRMGAYIQDDVELRFAAAMTVTNDRYSKLTASSPQASTC